MLIGTDGHIRIADFGLAKPLLGRSAAYSFCGSPEYMAPEMLKKYTLDNIGQVMDQQSITTALELCFMN